jgi:DNA-binding response OmpR family regulator
MHAHVLEQPRLQAISETQDNTVLIVDDDSALVEVLTLRLKNQGFKTLAAASGSQGLSMARREQPDLILLDLRLPDIDGFAICQELADSPDTCSIPVIILSGMERPDIIRRSREAGCQYYVRKPYDPNALLILIRHAIDEAGTWQMT